MVVGAATKSWYRKKAENSDTIKPKKAMPIMTKIDVMIFRTRDLCSGILVSVVLSFIFLSFFCLFFFLKSWSFLFYGLLDI